MARTVKRFVDLTFAVLGLVVFSPVMLVVAVLIRVRLGRPVLFRHTRPGYLGRPFVLMKFRTMLPPASPEAESDFDKRLTRLGRVLRKTSLDELPQLINVLRGELSLIGPRPLMLEYLPLYNADQARRHEMLPGLTGWAQINGRDAIKMEQRFEYDVWYVDNWSLRLDLLIFVRTIRQVLTGRGAGNNGAPIASLWRGNGDSVESDAQPAPRPVNAVTEPFAMVPKPNRKPPARYQVAVGDDAWTAAEFRLP